MEAVLDGQVESFMFLGTWVFKDKTLQVSFAGGQVGSFTDFDSVPATIIHTNSLPSNKVHFPSLVVWFCMEVVSMASLIWPLDLNDSNLVFFLTCCQ